MTESQQALRMKSSNSYKMGEIRKNQWREAKNSSENNLFGSNLIGYGKGKTAFVKAEKILLILRHKNRCLFVKTLVIPFRRAP